MALQHLRSGTANKRPLPTAMSDGQLAVNTNLASPGLFFKDSNGDLVKVGPVHIGTTAPNASPASTAATALVANTIYKVLTVGTSDFTAVGASANTVGVVFTASGTTTGTGTVSGEQGNEKGEMWLDNTGGAYDLKIYDGTAWRSQAGEFVNATGDTMTGDLIFNNANVVFEGSAADDHETTLTVANPTADRTITLPNVTGTVVTTGDTGSVTSTMLADGTIVNADVNAGAEIAVSKLANGTARQLLQTDSGGTGVEFTSNVDVPGTLDVTGAATLDSTLTVSGNVVVGTANADSKLWLKNGSSSGSGNAAELNFGNTEGTGSIKYSDVSNKMMLFYVDGYEIMRLEDYDKTAGASNVDHRVGIGTSNPQSMLDVEDGAQFVERSTVGNNDPRIKLEKVVNSSTITGRITTDNLVTTARVDAGTDSNPVATDIAISAINNSSNPTLYLNNKGTGTVSIEATGTIATTGVTIDAGTTTATRLWIKNSGNPGSNSAAHLDFGASQGTGRISYLDTGNKMMLIHVDGNEIMRIQDANTTAGGSGNIDHRVGIGTSSPSTMLHVAGAITSTSIAALGNSGIGSDQLNNYTGYNTLTVDGTAGGAVDFRSGGTDKGSIYSTSSLFQIQAQGSTIPITFRANSGEKMRISPAGNVFIGGSDAASAEIALNANGSAIFQSFISAFDVVSVSQTVGTHNCFAAQLSGSTKASIKADGSASFASGAFAIAANGQISTNVKSAGHIELDSTGSFSSPKIKLFSNTGAATFKGQVNCQDDSGNAQLVIGTLNSAIYATDSIFIQPGGTTKATFSSNGNATFAGNVEVQKSGGTITAASSANSKYAALYAGDSSNDSAVLWQNGALRFYNTTERMRIDSSGRVIVGGSNVQAHPNMDDLQVGNGSGNRGITISSGTSNFGTLAFGDSTDVSGVDMYAGAIEYYHSTDSMAFLTSSTSRMKIDSVGHCTHYRNTTTTGVGLLQCNSDIGGSNRAQWYVLSNGSVENRTGAYGTIASDERVKKDIVDATSQWEDIKNIKMRKFRYKTDGNDSQLQLGVIAQELEVVCPNLVTRKPATAEMSDESGGLIAEGEDILSWKQSIVHLKALKALQEAMERIEQLETKVAALEAG